MNLKGKYIPKKQMIMALEHIIKNKKKYKSHPRPLAEYKIELQNLKPF